MNKIIDFMKHVVSTGDKYNDSHKNTIYCTGNTETLTTD